MVEVCALRLVCSVMYLIPFTALVLCAVSCAAIRPQQGTPLGLIQAQGAGYLLSFEDYDGQQSPSLKQFLDEIEGVTEFKFQFSQEAAALLASKGLRLNGTRTISKEQFWSFLEVLLPMNDFMLTALELEGHFLVQALAGNGQYIHTRIRSGNPCIAPSD